MGIRDKPTARSPRQKCSAKTNRVDPSRVRRHLVVLAEAHLRRMPQSYARYYNELRTPVVDKDALLSCPFRGLDASCRMPARRCITNTSESEFSAYTAACRMRSNVVMVPADARQCGRFPDRFDCRIDRAAGHAITSSFKKLPATRQTNKSPWPAKAYSGAMRESAQLRMRRKDSGPLSVLRACA